MAEKYAKVKWNQVEAVPPKRNAASSVVRTFVEELEQSKTPMAVGEFPDLESAARFTASVRTARAKLGCSRKMRSRYVAEEKLTYLWLEEKAGE